MASLAVALTFKNNSRTLPLLLASVAGLADEIVAIDSGATDASADLVRAAPGARVIRHDWIGYAATKKLAVDACSRPWILLLDSDESLEPDLRASVAELLAADPPDTAACRVNRKTWYAGAPLDHAWQPEWRLRLFRRGRVRFSGFDPHESLVVDPSDRAPSRVVDLRGTLRHDSFETIAEHLARCAHYASIAGDALVSQGRRGSLARAVLSPPGAFLKQMVLKGAWRDGVRGWLAAGSTAAATLMKHLVLIEKSRVEPGRRRT